MKKYKVILFDLDGTLADTSEGIYNAHKFATKMVDYQLKEDDLKGVIGDSLIHVYRERYGLSDEMARYAIKEYRNWYAENGIHQALLYPGVFDTLSVLREKGIELAVATLKLESFAKTMLKSLGVASFFQTIRGVDENDKRTKSDIINLVIKELGFTKSDALLVGDSSNDAEGAYESKIDFIGCLYGFGYSRREEILADRGLAAINKIDELQRVLGEGIDG